MADPGVRLSKAATIPNAPLPAEGELPCLAPRFSLPR